MKYLLNKSVISGKVLLQAVKVMEAIFEKEYADA